ncbi:hypothetical protein KIK04_18150 [Paenibacillus sp. 481]|nr:hypothetical protein KIK04_18150 [Paenibacillus sp. 481]
MKRKRSWNHLWSLLRSAPRLLGSSRVPIREKALFVGLAALYWVIPLDFLPFIPIDDILFTMILMPWFAKRAAKYEQENDSHNHR